MHIELQGFGIYKVEEKDYQEFVRVLNLNIDFFLDLVEMGKNVIPILCINLEKINEEGPLPLGFVATEIGKKRIKELIENKIIAETQIR